MPLAFEPACELDGGAVAEARPRAVAIQAVVDLGYDAYLTSQWNELEPITDEGLKLCQLHGHALAAGLIEKLLAKLKVAVHVA